MADLLFIEGRKLENPPALRALFYGEGVFETFRWKQSPPVFLSMHIDRMRRGAAFLSLPFPDESHIRHLIQNAIAQASENDLHVKICLLGEGDLAFYARPRTASILVSLRTHIETPDTVSLWVSPEKRSAQSRLFSHKTVNYLGNVLTKRQAQENDFDEVLFMDTDDRVTETSCHNVFWMTGNKLFTPSSECPILPGVTREIVLQCSRKLGYKPTCGDFSLRELAASDYLFLTNSAAGMVYVNNLNGEPRHPPPRSYEVIRESLLQEFQW